MIIQSTPTFRLILRDDFAAVFTDEFTYNIEEFFSN